MVPRATVIVWNWSIHCPPLSAMFNSLHSSLNQELFEKHLCNQGSHYEKYGRFPLRKGSIHVQPPNQYFSLSAKMNGTQRRTMISRWRMYCTYYSMPKRLLSGWSDVKQWKNQACIALAVIELHQSEGIS